MIYKQYTFVFRLCCLINILKLWIVIKAVIKLVEKWIWWNEVGLLEQAGSFHQDDQMLSFRGAGDQVFRQKSKTSIQNISVLTFGMIFLLQRTSPEPGPKIHFLSEMLKECPNGPKLITKDKKELGWPYRTIQAPSWRLIWLTCRVWLFQSKMGHFWADVSQWDWTQKKTKEALTYWHYEYQRIICR